MTWLWAAVAFGAGVFLGVAIQSNRKETTGTLGLKPGTENKIMATLEQLTAASAELGAKIDALIAAVKDVAASIDAALALDAEADAAERQGLLEDIQAKTAKIEAALTPGEPVQPEDLPPE